MDFYIPKYTDLFIRDGKMSQKFGMKGEYRAVLTGEDGRLKSDTGWKDNTLLDRGLGIMRNQDPFQRMFLGDSDVAVDITQTGILGATVGTYEYLGSPSYAVIQPGPTFERISIEQCIFSPGESTGTIKEFCLAQVNATNAQTQGCVRVVLDTPIIKGAGDQLLIQHRMTVYPPAADVTGTITIGGDNPEDYNYTMRCFKIDDYMTAHPDSFYWLGGGYGSAFTGEISLNTGTGPAGVSIGDCYTTPSQFGGIGGTLGSYYNETGYKFSVDQGNANGGSFRSYYNYWHAASGNWGGQFRWGKVSDDSPLIKLNTHTLEFAMRLLPQRYVP